jgi:hypothetical protein
VSTTRPRVDVSVPNLADHPCVHAYDLRRTPALQALADANFGVVHLDDCRAHDVSDEVISWLVESGRWQSPFPRTYVVFSGPIPRITVEQAALRYAGEGATLCGLSAGAKWNLCPTPELIHVGIAYEREVEDQPGLKIHRSRVLREEDVHPAKAPRRLRIEPTVVQMLSGAPTATAALALVAGAVGSRQTTAERLAAAIRERTQIRWRRQALEALPDVRAGAHSVLELLDARLRRRHGLPPGERQFRRDRKGVEYLDVVIREFRLHVELDGRLGHEKFLERLRDMRRDNASELGQMRHLRYGYADMYDRGCEAMIEQAVILRQQGWTGRFRRCRRCPVVVPPDL